MLEKLKIQFDLLSEITKSNFIDELQTGCKLDERQVLGRA